MNYLETGLPHTQFYRKKTQFSPPRFIPLCGLSRKYQGLEPLSRNEVDVLIRRLSEPKKTPEVEEQTFIAQVRPRSSPGSGRFVGQKKMSSLEIEQMVSRLCSRRPTKEYPYVDDTVEAEDILGMTDRMNDSSDSEDETVEPEADRTQYFLRRHSSATTMRSDTEKVDTCRQEMHDSEMTNSSKYKRHSSAFARRNESYSDNSSNKSYDSSSKYKKSTKMRAHFDTIVAESRHDNASSIKIPDPVKSWAARVSSERVTKEEQDIAKYKPELKYKPTVSFSRGTYFSFNREKAKSARFADDRNNVLHDHEEETVTEITIKRPMSHPANRPSYKYERKSPVVEKLIDLSAMFDTIARSCRPAELTRPPPSIEPSATSEKTEQKISPELKPNTPKATRTLTVSPTSSNIPADTELIDTPKQPDATRSPRSKFPRLEDNRSNKRFGVKPNDDSLIDQVASFNRSPKFRSKR